MGIVVKASYLEFVVGFLALTYGVVESLAAERRFAVLGRLDSSYAALICTRVLVVTTEILEHLQQLFRERLVLLRLGYPFR